MGASAITLLVSHYIFSFLYKMYKKAWEYASIGELLIILKTSTCSSIATAGIQLLFFQKLSFRLWLVTWMTYILFVCGSRFIWRLVKGKYSKEGGQKKKALIVGAGSAGAMVARQLLSNNNAQLLPVAFIDDDIRKHGLEILGIPVLGGMDQLNYAIQKLQVENIILAIPSLCKQELQLLFKKCLETKIQTQILPMLEDIVTGKVSVNKFRDVQVEDLLGRDPVELDTDGISEYIQDKIILVTGAGGSIGSEICRQILKFKPKQLVLLGHGENSIYSIEMELRDSYGHEEIIFSSEIMDIQDKEKMKKIMEHYRPHVVYHAAAHKHVPLMEKCPEEAVKNNLIGTINVAEAACLYEVEVFVLISSDKAVNPTSVMGATKRLAEIVIQDKNKNSRTKFTMVRFGNVLESRGSVIPLFKKQIQQGGPVTVTHQDMVRYFMTIPEASRLVIQASALAKGGEIFVLDMGEPVRIVDLAKNLIILSGSTTEEIGVEFTGLRPGEKLFEELLNQDEIIENQIYPGIYLGKTMNYEVEKINKLISIYPELSRDDLRHKLIYLTNTCEMSKGTSSLSH